MFVFEDLVINVIFINIILCFEIYYLFLIYYFILFFLFKIDFIKDKLYYIIC